MSTNIAAVTIKRDGNVYTFPQAAILPETMENSGNAVDFAATIYLFNIDANHLNIDRFSLDSDGLEQLNRQLAAPMNTLGGQMALFGRQFAADMNDLRREHPFIFYGGLLLAAGALVILFWPAAAAFPLFTLGGTALTAGLAVKGGLFAAGGLGMYHSAQRYREAGRSNPATPIGRYLVEKEKIMQAGTFITLGAGMLILGAETGLLLRTQSLARAGKMAGGQRGQNWGGFLATCAAVCHPDELAMVFGNVEKAARYFAENTSYICQQDTSLGTLACVEEGIIRLNELGLSGNGIAGGGRASIPLDPSR